jgi:ABC-type lipoprotein export system ATPase subunit
LENLVLILEEAFKTLKSVHSNHLILAVGNTGSGKSTMLTSLMFGSNALHETKVEYEIKVPELDGPTKTKIKKKKVID